MSKTCSTCNTSYPIENFLKDRFKCKDCRSKVRKENYALAKEQIGTKECNSCQKTFDLSNFKTGTKMCTNCSNKKRRDARMLDKQPINNISQITVPDGLKLCKICLAVKNEDQFRPKRLKCKSCENKERVAYKKEQIEKQPVPNFEKEEDDFSRKLKASCRWRIRETIPAYISKKFTDENRFGYVYDIIGCDINFLKKWFQFCYDENMNDNNYGDYWFMDHVIPIYTFDIKNNYEINKKLCYSWYNISPLNAIDNNKKFKEIDKKQLQVHLDKLQEFCAENGITIDTDYKLLCAKHLDAGNP